MKTLTTPLLPRRPFLAFAAILLAVLALPCVGLPRQITTKDQPILQIEAGGHTGMVRQVVFADEGRKLVSVGADKVVRIWDTETGGLVRTLRGQIGDGPVGQLFTAAVSGSRLAVGGYLLKKADTEVGGQIVKNGADAGEIRIFDTATGRLVRSLTVELDVVNSLAYSPDGANLAAAVGNNVYLLDPENGTWRFRRTEHKAPVAGVAFSPDSKYLASLSRDGAILIWDVTTGKRLKELRSADTPYCIAWGAGPGSGTLAVGATGHVHSWEDPVSAAKPRPNLDQKDVITCLAFSPDGSTLVTGSGLTPTANDQAAYVWSLSGNTSGTRFSGHTATLFSVACSTRDNLAASADLAGRIYLWDRGTGKVKQALNATGGPVWSVAWSADEKRIGWSWDEKTAPSQGFDLYQAHPLPNAQGITSGAAVKERNGVHLSIVDGGQAVALSDAGGKEIGRIRDTENWAPEDRVSTASFTPDGKVIVATAYTLGVYDSAGKTPKRLFGCEGHTAPILAVAISPAGRYFASAAADETIRIWPLKGGSGKSIGPLLSLFAGKDGEWVAWNEATGYYAASAEGDSLLGWQVNRGIGKAADFVRASTLGRSESDARLYRPEVISRLLEAGSVEAAMQMAKTAGYTKAATPVLVSREIADLPQVELVSVSDTTRNGEVYSTTKLKITLNLKITTPKPEETDLRLNVNRPGATKQLREVEERGPNRALETLPLREGLNVVSIVAKNSAGESAPVTIKVEYHPSQPAPVRRRLFVLSVGVTHYNDPAIEQQAPLRFPGADAQAVAAYFKKQQGGLYESVNEIVLVDQDATRGRIEQEIVTLEKQVKGDDTVLLFLSGHGLAKERHYYFAPADIQLADVTKTGMLWSDMLKRLSDLPCADVVVLLDHCYSGGVGREMYEQERGIDPRVESARSLRAANMFTLTSSLPAQESHEHPKWGQGAFTFALLEALAGKATPLSGQGSDLTLDDIRRYVAKRVPELVREVGQPLQQPRLFFPTTLGDDAPADLKLARLPR